MINFVPGHAAEMAMAKLAPQDGVVPSFSFHRKRHQLVKKRGQIRDKKVLAASRRRKEVLEEMEEDEEVEVEADPLADRAYNAARAFYGGTVGVEFYTPASMYTC